MEKRGKRKTLQRQPADKLSSSEAAWLLLVNIYGVVMGPVHRLRILFKQSLSEHREADRDTVSLRLPCGPLSQHRTLGKQWSHAGMKRSAAKNRRAGLWRATSIGVGGELECASPGLGPADGAGWLGEERKEEPGRASRPVAGGMFPTANYTLLLTVCWQLIDLVLHIHKQHKK